MEIYTYFIENFFQLLTDPLMIILVICSTLLGILFGATPGLTATLGVALLTTLTYGMDHKIALVALLAMYVGAIYGGSYTAILLNIPGTAASAATAIDGYVMTKNGQAGRVLGLTTTASAIGTVIGLIFVITLSPIIGKIALQFSSFEYFLLAIFGILISSSLTSKDLVTKGWIAGLLGLFISCVGREDLQSYPRFTFGMAELDSGVDIVAVLIGVFGIPQVISVLISGKALPKVKKIKKVVPDFKTIKKNIGVIVRSSFIGVGIGAVPGIGEDIAGWISYAVAKKTSKNGHNFGKGEAEAVISTETSNNACIGGAMIPLLTLGIPGSPPAMMLLGALMLHNITPGPMLIKQNPLFISEVTSILLLASLAMFVCGITLSKYVVRVLNVPYQLFMPIIAVLCVIGSYALGLNIFNLYLMIPLGIIAYFLGKMDYPIPPLVIGAILGPMADTNFRRAMIVSEGDLTAFLSRPVCLILILLCLLIIFSRLPMISNLAIVLNKKS